MGKIFKSKMAWWRGASVVCLRGEIMAVEKITQNKPVHASNLPLPRPSTKPFCINVSRVVALWLKY